MWLYVLFYFCSVCTSLWRKILPLMLQEIRGNIKEKKDLRGRIDGWLQPFWALLNNLWRMEPELNIEQTYFTRLMRATGAKKLEEKAFIIGKVKIRYLKIVI